MWTAKFSKNTNRMYVIDRCIDVLKTRMELRWNIQMKVLSLVSRIVRQQNPISGLDVVLEYKVFLNADY